ncbi:hypothetical protein HN873_071467 [Arachis hypogaea]
MIFSAALSSNEIVCSLKRRSPLAGSPPMARSPLATISKLNKTTRSIAQVFPLTIFFGGDLLYQRFSSIDEICCASVSYGVELCSVISPSPSSFIEHLVHNVQFFEHLKKYLGIRHELDGGFTWSLIHRTEDNSKASSRGMINIIISVSKMELADKVAAVGLLVVVPDLLYGDYFSYDPQFDREGWLKKHGEAKECEDPKPTAFYWFGTATVCFLDVP